MSDAQRYRINAAECLSAAERCEPTYRGLTFAIAASWLSLARQQEAVDELVANWSEHRSATPTASNRQRYQGPPDLRRPAPPAPGPRFALRSAHAGALCEPERVAALG
jgi:hypothetical protein